MRSPLPGKIRFMHIPKAAGTSFSFCLRSLYNDPPMFRFGGNLKQDLRRFDELDRNFRNSIVLFTGHAPIATGNPLVDRVPIITFLREPVIRVKSFCQHVREGKSPHLLAAYPPENFNLHAFLRQSQVGHLTNLQTKFLVGYDFYEAHSHDPKSVLALAKSNLETKIAGFGIVKHFDESLLLLRHQFNWDWPVYHSFNRKSRFKRVTFGDEDIEIIRRLNRLDIELYKFACRLFSDRLSELGNLSRDLRRLRFLLRCHSPFIAVRRAISAVHRRVGSS